MIATGSTYREKIEAEARAKIFWGDAADDVVRHLRENGLSVEEADEMVKIFAGQRAAIFRRLGMKKTLLGSAVLALVLVPWLGLSVYLHRFLMPPLPGLLLLSMGLVYGGYSCLKGSMMCLWPQNETGDIGDAE